MSEQRGQNQGGQGSGFGQQFGQQFEQVRQRVMESDAVKTMQERVQAEGPELVERVNLYQDHVRAGVFRPIQEAAVAALTGPQETVEERRAIYEGRRDRVLAAVPGSRADSTFFVWWRLPDGLSADRILAETRVAVAPGEGFGPSGAGWARISVATPDERLDAGLERLRGFV